MSNLDTASGNKLFDYTGSDLTAWDKEAYKALISNWDASMDKFLTVVDGDLIVKPNAVAYVNGEYTDASKNQFKTHDEAIASGAERIITTGGTTDDKIAHDGKEAVVQAGTFNGTVSGGSIINSNYKIWNELVGNTSLGIEGGTFNKMVIGADRVDAGTAERVGDVNTTISGGTFNSIVAGGMLYAEKSIKGQSLLVGDVNLTVSGGEFHKFIYGGSISATATFASRTAIEGDINITVDATGSNTLAFLDTANIMAGSYRTGAVYGNTQVTFTGNGSNITWGDRIQVWGGSSGDYSLILKFG